MFKRHKLEKEEKKNYSDAGVSTERQTSLYRDTTHTRTQVSNEMKTLNRTFAKLHGVSSLFNLWAVIGTVFHGLWIANKGLPL